MIWTTLMISTTTNLIYCEFFFGVAATASFVLLSGVPCARRREDCGRRGEERWGAV